MRKPPIMTPLTIERWRLHSYPTVFLPLISRSILGRPTSMLQQVGPSENKSRSRGSDDVIISLIQTIEMHRSACEESITPGRRNTLEALQGCGGELEIVRTVSLDGDLLPDFGHEQFWWTPSLEITEDLSSCQAATLSQIPEDPRDRDLI